jgi:hypothetical protein
MLSTSGGLLKPKKVQWGSSGPGDVVSLTANVDEPVPPATLDVPFDPKLEVLTRDLILPEGSTFQLIVAGDLPVTYQSRDSSVIVTDSGLVQAVSIGTRVVIVRFKSQFTTVGIKVTQPRALYLEKQGAAAATVRLLDEDGQQYSGRAGSTFSERVMSILLQ